MKKVLMVSMLALYADISAMENYSNSPDTVESSSEEDRNNTPLHIAAEKGDVESIQRLIRQGHDINDRNSFGETPLHLAASEGHLNAVKALLRVGADANAVDREGDTPLHMSSLDEHHEVSNELIKAGAKDNIVNIYGQTASDYAALNKKLEELDRQIEDDNITYSSTDALDNSVGDIASGDSSPPRLRQNKVS